MHGTAWHVTILRWSRRWDLNLPRITLAASASFRAAVSCSLRRCKRCSDTASVKLLSAWEETKVWQKPPMQFLNNKFLHDFACTGIRRRHKHISDFNMSAFSAAKCRSSWHSALQSSSSPQGTAQVSSVTFLLLVVKMYSTVQYHTVSESYFILQLPLQNLHWPHFQLPHNAFYRL